MLINIVSIVITRKEYSFIVLTLIRRLRKSVQQNKLQGRI